MSSPPPSRLSGFTHVDFDITENKNLSYELKKLEQPTADLQPPEELQHHTITTSQIPQPTMSTPCILHPRLTPGQKRYLYTAAKAHSEDHVRNLIYQHYLNVLHRSTSTYVSHTRHTAFIRPSPVVELNPTPEEEHSGREGNEGKAKVTNKKRLILPKINSHLKRPRPPRKSNARKSMSPRRNRNRDSVGLSQWETDEDSLVSDLSSLSLENEDFLYI